MCRVFIGTPVAQATIHSFVVCYRNDETEKLEQCEFSYLFEWLMIQLQDTKDVQLGS